MEGGGFGFTFGGDPDEIMRGLREFAEAQAETVQEAQREQFATLTLNTAVELTAAALQQIQPQGGVDEQAIVLRDAMRVLFPEAVALVRAAADYGNFVRIDMEDSSTTDDTLRLYRELREEGHDNLGVVFQARLRRTLGDIEGLADLRPSVRLCKGIYLEPVTIAFTEYE